MIWIGGSIARDIFYPWILVLFLLLGFGEPTLTGIATKHGVFLTSSSTINRGGITMHHNFKWLRPIGQNVIVGMEGDPSDCDVLFQKLQSLKYSDDFPSCLDDDITCSHVAEYCQRLIHSSIRSPARLRVNCLIGGWVDPNKSCPILHWVDELGVKQNVTYASAGACSQLFYSMLDRENTIAEISGRTTSNVFDLLRKSWKLIGARSSNEGKTPHVLVLVDNHSAPQESLLCNDSLSESSSN